MDDAHRQPVEELLRQWYSRAKGAQWHYAREAQRLRRLHYWLGVPVVLLSAAVGSTVFAAIGHRVDVWAQVLVGMISVLAASLAALQTFFRYDERAEQHRRIAAGFASLRRDMEVAQVRIAGQAPVDLSVIDGIRSRLEELLLSGPDLMFSGAPNETQYQYLEYLSRPSTSESSAQPNLAPEVDASGRRLTPAAGDVEQT